MDQRDFTSKKIPAFWFSVYHGGEISPGFLVGWIKIEVVASPPGDYESRPGYSNPIGGYPMAPSNGGSGAGAAGEAGGGIQRIDQMLTQVITEMARNPHPRITQEIIGRTYGVYIGTFYPRDVEQTPSDAYQMVYHTGTDWVIAGLLGWLHSQRPKEGPFQAIPCSPPPLDPLLPNGPLREDSLP